MNGGSNCETYSNSLKKKKNPKTFILFFVRIMRKMFFLACLIFYNPFWINLRLPKYDESTTFFVNSIVIKSLY